MSSFSASRRLLADAADQGGPGSFQETQPCAQGLGGQADVGIQKHQQRMTGVLGQGPAGVLLAAPAGRKRAPEGGGRERRARR